MGGDLVGHENVIGIGERAQRICDQINKLPGGIPLGRWAENGQFQIRAFVCAPDAK